MPTSPTAASAQRARRIRPRREVPKSTIVGASKNGADGESKSEKSKIIAGLVSNNRFTVLCSNEPAPGVEGEQQSTFPLRRERPMASKPRVDKVPVGQVSLRKKMKGESMATTFPASLSAERTSVPTLVSHTPVTSTRTEPSQQLSAPTAASTSSTKPQVHPSPLVIQAEIQSIPSSEPSSAFNRVSPDFDTAAPYLAPEPAPTLPTPPMPPDRLLTPCLATLPVHPSLDFNSLTSPKSSGPKSRQLASPIPTSADIFPSDDPMRYIVKTTSGKIFSIAAEIAAANRKSTLKFIGNVLIPGPAKTYGEVEGKMNRKKLDCRRGECVNSSKDTADESEEAEGDGEEWLGKEEGFWKQPLEKGNVGERRTQSWT